jgi:hypothetical protein
MLGASTQLQAKFLTMGELRLLLVRYPADTPVRDMAGPTFPRAFIGVVRGLLDSSCGTPVLGRMVCLGMAVQL